MQSERGRFFTDTIYYRGMIKTRLSAKRFRHSLNVADEAKHLAPRFGADAEKAELAGILHDISKEIPRDGQLQIVKKYGIVLDNVEQATEKLWHAITGAALVEHEVLVTDPDILNAIRYHTTARVGMSALEMSVYLADCISADRDYDGVEDIRRAASVSVMQGMEAALDFSIREVMGKRALIHPDTVRARNELILQKNARL